MKYLLWVCVCIAAAGTAIGAPVTDALRPENVVVVVNEESWASMTLADAYVRLRGIPARNVIFLKGLLHFETIGVEAFRRQILTPVLSAIQARGLQNTIDCIAYSSDIPYEIDFRADLGDDAVDPEVGDYGSLTGMTYLYAAVLAGTLHEYTSLKSNRYVRRAVAVTAEAPSEAEVVPVRAAEQSTGKQEHPDYSLQQTCRFRAQTAWDTAGMPTTGNEGTRYMLSTMLGVTSGRGTSVQEAVAALERAAAADGTRPAGTIYYMINNDVRSRTRRWGFEAAIRMLKEEDVTAVIEEGTLPQGRSDIAGAMVGTATFDFAASGSRILPGAICEHLTSFGGIMTWGAEQSALTEFLRAGAAGSSGTVMEPYAIQAKFPDPFLQVHYARGASLAEAFYQSVAAPYQLLIVGDPLCRPWGDARTVVNTAPNRIELPALPDEPKPAVLRRGFRMAAGEQVRSVSGDSGAQPWWKAADIKPGDRINLEGYIEVPTDDMYQFQIHSAGNAGVSVGGRNLPVTGHGPWQMFPVALEAGWHTVSISLSAGGADKPWNGPPLELRFGAAGIQPLIPRLRFCPRPGEVIRNMGLKARVAIEEMADDPLSARMQFAVDGLEAPVEGTMTMVWETPEGGDWSIEPARAETRVVQGVCEPVAFHIRYRGTPFVADTFFRLPTCQLQVRSAMGIELADPMRLPLDLILNEWPRPKIVIPRVPQPPNIDGVLDDAAWGTPATITGFLHPQCDQPTAQPTMVWLAWDDRCLYIAARCTEPALDALHLKARRRDDAAYADDSIEFFLSANAEAQPYYQIVVNAAGIVFDGRGFDNSWDGDFTVATGREAGAWTIEMSVPWTTFGKTLPGSDTILRLLVARNRVAGRAPEQSLWPFVAGGNHQPHLFGQAILARPEARDAQPEPPPG